MMFNPWWVHTLESNPLGSITCHSAHLRMGGAAAGMSSEAEDAEQLMELEPLPQEPPADSVSSYFASKAASSTPQVRWGSPSIALRPLNMGTQAIVSVRRGLRVALV